MHQLGNLRTDGVWIMQRGDKFRMRSSLKHCIKIYCNEEAEQESILNVKHWIKCIPTEVTFTVFHR